MLTCKKCVDLHANTDGGDRDPLLWCNNIAIVTIEIGAAMPDTSKSATHTATNNGLRNLAEDCV